MYHQVKEKKSNEGTGIYQLNLLFYMNWTEFFLATFWLFGHGLMMFPTCDPRHSAPGRKRMNKKEQARKNFTSAACSLVSSDLPNHWVLYGVVENINIVNT